MTTWTGAGRTTSWDDAGNWSGGAIPVSYGAVSIGMAGASVVVSVASGSGPRAASLTIGDGHVGETVQLDLAGSFSLDGSGILVSGGAALSSIGGAIDLSTGGLAVASGGSYTETGGTLTASTLGNAGTTVLTGAVAVAAAAANSGTLTETGTLSIGSGLVNSGTMTLAGTVTDSAGLTNTGHETLSGAVTVGASLSNSGTMVVTGSVNLLGETIIGMGSIDIDGGRLGTSATPISIVGSQGFTLENGGFLSLRNGIGATVDFGSGGGTLSLQDEIGIVTTPIRNFGVGDRIEIAGLDITGDTVIANGNNSYTIALDAGPYYAPVVLTGVTLAAGVKPSQIALSVSGGETIVSIACFLSGTRIATAAGEVAVEQVAVGDQVVAIEHGRRTLRPVRWHGSRTVDLSLMDADDAREAAPVRIRAGAFADGVPSRDLLITPEHCVLVDDRLVPARMLVNGSSIVREAGLHRFTVHHIECDRHAILLSDGLPTESYLDTGNRRGFGTPADDATATPSGWADAAAPLETGRGFVEPIWHRLAARAASTGQPVAASTVPATTTDPALRIRLDDGSLLAAARRKSGRHVFVLPPGTRGVAITSRVFVPSRIEGPFVDDRRRLGVAVRDARLWTGLHTRILSVDPAAGGWHAAETGAQAVWTDGAGRLELDPSDSATVLELELVLAGRYLLQDCQALQVAA